MYIYIHTYILLFIHTYIYIYTYMSILNFTPCNYHDSAASWHRVCVCLRVKVLPEPTSVKPARRQKTICTVFAGTILLRAGCLLPVLIFIVTSDMCEPPIGQYVHTFQFGRNGGQNYLHKYWPSRGVHNYGNRTLVCTSAGESTF